MRYWKGEAHAKINLSLDVLERLPNGYHRLAMIMQTIGLSDTVEITLTDAGIALACETAAAETAAVGNATTENATAENAARAFPMGSGVIGMPVSATAIDEIPTDARNLAWKAAAAFFKAHPAGGAAIRLVKRIPAAAGLAGGSADAAAVLRGLNFLHGFPFGQAALERIGVTLGADVPYCLRGGTCLAEGIGEILTELPDFSNRWIVLVKPPFPVSTPWVFGQLKLAEVDNTPGHVRPDTAMLLSAIGRGDTEAVACGMRNVLEPVTSAAHPEIQAIRNRLLALGALGSRMSGSGPSVFAVFADEAAARNAQAALSVAWPQSWAVPTVPSV